jgi:hypothetical protein
MPGVLLGASRCSVAGEPCIAVSIDEPKYFSTQLERKRNSLLFSSANNAAIFETHYAAPSNAGLIRMCVSRHRGARVRN